jgi:hypothetical protein
MYYSLRSISQGLILYEYNPLHSEIVLLAPLSGVCARGEERSSNIVIEMLGIQVSPNLESYLLPPHSPSQPLRLEKSGGKALLD